MKQKFLLKTMLLLWALIVGGVCSVWADDKVTLVSGSGTSGYAIPEGWISSGTVEGGSYLKFDGGGITSPEFAPHTGLSFTYTVATFGSGTNHPLQVKILDASTGEVISEKTTATPSSSSYINTGSPLSLGDVSVPFKIQLYASSGKGVRLRNYSITGIPAGSSSAVKTTTTIDASGITNTDVYAGTVAGSLTATVKDNEDNAIEGATVTWSGDNDDVATINASTGAVTLVAAGTVNFTVTYAGVEDEYESSSNTYEMTVTDSTPYTVTFGDKGSVTQETAGAAVTLPERDDISSYAFVGWSETNVAEETTTAPTIIPAGSYTPTANITLYPVYTKTVGGGGTTNKTASVTISDYASANKWDNGIAYQPLTMDANISVGGTISGNNFKYYSSDNSWRFYNGGAFTISASNGAKLTSATLTISAGILKYDESELKSGTAFDLTGSSAEISCTANAKITAISVSYSITGAGTTYYWSTPVAAAVEMPSIAIAENPFLFSTTATITCATEGAAIKYSFDGETWNDYTEALTITETKTIYAKAIKDDDESSIAQVTATKNLAEPTVTISATGITNTNVFTGTAAGSLAASVTYNDAAVEGAAVTWSGNKDEVATIDPSTGAVTLIAAGTVTFTATYAGNSDYSEKAATYEMTVTNSDPNGPGTENNPYTVAQARAAIDAGTGIADVYATGTVSEIKTAYNATNNNISYNISSDGLTTSDQLQIYRGACSGEDEIRVGDVVVVKGNLTKYSSTYEFSAGSTLQSVKLVAPTFSLAAGAVTPGTEVEISDLHTAATIYYTIDGTIPTSESTKYTGAIIITETTTIKAIAVKDATSSDVVSATYTCDAVAQPSFETVSGTAVYYGTKVVVSCATEGAVIYYTLTTDGSTPVDPTSASEVYPDGGIAITAGTVNIKVIAKNDEDYSAVAEATYTLKAPDNPMFSLKEGMVSKGASLELTTTDGASIRYTTDGTEPTSTVGSVYSDAIIINAPLTIKAIAYDGAGNVSSVVTKAYTIFVGEVVTFDATKDTGTSLNKNGISFTTSATADGVYKFYKSSSTTFATETGKIKMIEFAGTSGYAVSNMTANAGVLNTSDSPNGTWTGSASSVKFTASAAQTRATVISVYVTRTSAPTFSIEGGEYNSAQSVEICSATDGAVIYYTTDGSAPTSSSTVYSDALTITESMTLKAIAVYDGVSSSISKVTFTMNRPATPAFDVAECVFEAPFDLHISTETDGAAIYYTTNGSTPNTESFVYSDKVAISAETTTVKAVAVKDGLTSDVYSATYTFDSRTTPSFSLSSTAVDLYVNDEGNVTLTTNHDGTITATSSNNTNLPVSYNTSTKVCTFTPVQAGEYTITFSATGSETYKDAEAVATITVTKKPTTMEMETAFDDGKDLKNATQGFIMGTVKFADSALLPQPTVTYTSSNTSVATVDEDGNVTFVKAGNTILSASFAGNDEYDACEEMYELELYDSTPQALEVIVPLNSSAASFGTTAPNKKTVSVKNVSVTTNTGSSSTALVAESDHVRMYKNSNMVIAAPSGYVLTGIEFTEPSSGNKWDGDPKVSTGRFSSKSWLGNASTVTFTFSGGQCRIASITATLAPCVTLNKYGFATYCSAHPIDFSKAEGFTAWRISDVDADGTVTFSKITETIKEGQGVLLYNKDADGENKTTVTLTVGESAGATEFTTSENKLVGITEPTDVSANEYYGLKDNKFVKVNAGTIPAGKALLPASEIPSGARELNFVFEGEQTTSISEECRVKSEEFTTATIFDLQGRKVNKPQKGLYIVNGRKVVVK